MMKFVFADLLRGPDLIAKFEQVIALSKQSYGGIKTDAFISPANLPLLRHIVDDLTHIADNNGLDAALAGVRRLAIKLDKLEEPFPVVEVPAEYQDDPLASSFFAEDQAKELRQRADEVADALMYLRQSFADQIGSRAGVVLSPQEARLLSTEAQPLFGNEVFERFPVAADDIAESGACLAFNRGTAAVFHLMRVLEAGLKALAGELGITYAPSWESYIRQLDKLLDGGEYKSLTPQQKEKLPVYREILGDLVSVKSAWRNPTMHIVRHYDTAQAHIIFEATRSLMQQLAEKLSFDPVVSLVEPDHVSA